MRYFNFNGTIYKEDEPVIGPACRGLRYGDGLFETMKWDTGRIAFEAEHFARLWQGMEILQFDIPKWFTAAALIQHVHQLIQKNNFQNFVRVRLQVFRGAGGLYDAKNNFPNFIIEVWQLSEKPILNSNGLIVGIYKEVKKSSDILSNLKNNNFLPYALAALYAKKEKWNDALILNSAGRVCESTKANLFIIKDEEIKTPSLQEGCIAGIMRNHILKKLATFGWSVEETEVSEDELKNADEVFLTNAIINLQWVKQSVTSTYTNALVQKIYAQLFS